MGLRQEFRFRADSAEAVRAFLRGFSSIASIEDRTDFFVYSQFPGQPAFTFDCELIEAGLASERAGEYFPFLGQFIEALSGTFGPVEIEDL